MFRQTCSDCLDKSSPYCAWDLASAACVSHAQVSHEDKYGDGDGDDDYKIVMIMIIFRSRTTAGWYNPSSNVQFCLRL